MTITNQTLMWLAPLAAAVAMTVTTMTTRWIDNRRPRKGPDLPDPAAIRGYQLLAREAALAAIEAADARARGGPEPKARLPEASRLP